MGGEFVPKSEIRKQYKEKRGELSPETVKEKSIIAEEFFINCEFFKNAASVMLYIPLKNETDTEIIINKCFEEDKRVSLPVTSPVNFEITPHIAHKNTVFNKGTFNVFEPQNTEISEISQVDVVLVPGIAFDKNGARIGFGKGCYDKLLKNYKGIKVGFCYDFQVLSELPVDENDVTMDYIVTEKGIIECK